MAHVIAIDAGTSGVRALAIDESAQVSHISYRELTQYYPQPGWVEHDAGEIWRFVQETLLEVTSRLAEDGQTVSASGITNQRETVVAWDRDSGAPLARAIVWQDKRTAPRCASLREAGHLETIRSTTGLVLDPYFSATKIHWLLDEGSLKVTPSLALGTVDSWILWNLTNGVFATDLSNASRTMLCNIDTGQWSPELCDLFGVPLDSLAEIKPSCGRFGRVAHLELGALQGVPISGILGDQQAALFGQACFAPGMVKATYGTGAFVVLQAGTTRPPISEGLLTTVAWDLGEGSGVSYAIEGSAFVAGAAIQWLRDELGILGDASEIEPLARSVSGSDGLSFIPAFVGLGSPWWDESARGALVGITRGSNRAALANAVIDAMAFEVRAITDAMQAVVQDSLVELRADGGAAVMDLLLERQANQSRLDVARPISLDTTARGAATIAGLAEGVFESLEQLSSLWHVHSRFSPSRDAAGADAAYAAWLRALEKTRDWVR